MKKDQFISECEQSFQKMGLDFYEVMKKAPEVVERWKKYYPLAQEVWSNARSRESLAAALITGPDPNPEELERWLAFIRALPYFLRGSFQGIAKALPPPPGGRPRELTLPESRDICLQIGHLYGEGGYEVTHACRVDPGAGTLIEAEAGRLLRELHR